MIITIIVLLILAGVTISAIIGDNGILNQAINASDYTNESQILEELQFAATGLYMSNPEYSLDVSIEDLKKALEKENFSGNIVLYTYVRDEKVGIVTVEKNGEVFLYRIYEGNGKVEREYKLHLGDSIHDLYVNNGAYSEQEMDEWLGSLEYNETQEMADESTNVGGYYCHYLVYIRDTERINYGYITAVDLSRYLDNGTIYNTGLEGYILVAGYYGIDEDAKLIYSTVSEDISMFGEIEKGWQGVTFIEYNDNQEYRIYEISEDLKDGIFAWMSWKYNH